MVEPGRCSLLSGPFAVFQAQALSLLPSWSYLIQAPRESGGSGTEHGLARPGSAEISVTVIPVSSSQDKKTCQALCIIAQQSRAKSWLAP